MAKITCKELQINNNRQSNQFRTANEDPELVDSFCPLGLTDRITRTSSQDMPSD